MKRSVIIQFQVAKRDCPKGDWQPTIHCVLESGYKRIWGLSAWPNPFLPKGTMPGTWLAATPILNIIDHNESVVAEKEESGEIVTIRLARLIKEPALT